jgi:hypothetical protein
VRRTAPATRVILVAAAKQSLDQRLLLAAVLFMGGVESVNLSIHEEVDEFFLAQQAVTVLRVMDRSSWRGAPRRTCAVIEVHVRKDMAQKSSEKERKNEAQNDKYK